jgi:hypothetical protein
MWCDLLFGLVSQTDVYAFPPECGEVVYEGVWFPLRVASVRCTMVERGIQCESRMRRDVEM